MDSPDGTPRRTPIAPRWSHQSRPPSAQNNSLLEQVLAHKKMELMKSPAVREWLDELQTVARHDAEREAEGGAVVGEATASDPLREEDVECKADVGADDDDECVIVEPPSGETGNRDCGSSRDAINPASNSEMTVHGVLAFLKSWSSGHHGDGQTVPPKLHPGLGNGEHPATNNEGQMRPGVSAGNLGMSKDTAESWIYSRPGPGVGSQQQGMGRGASVAMATPGATGVAGSLGIGHGVGVSRGVEGATFMSSDLRNDIDDSAAVKNEPGIVQSQSSLPHFVSQSVTLSQSQDIVNQSLPSTHATLAGQSWPVIGTGQYLPITQAGCMNQSLPSTHVGINSQSKPVTQIVNTKVSAPSLVHSLYQEPQQHHQQQQQQQQQQLQQQQLQQQQQLLQQALQQRQQEQQHIGYRLP